MRSDLESQSQVYDSFQREQVHVYLRNVRKEARLVPLHTPAKASDLTIIASTRFNIPEERVILFYSGFRIDNYDMPIALTEKSIIHIIDRRNLTSPKITVLFKPVGWKVPSFRLSLSPDMTIKEIMSSYLVPQFNVDQSRFFIVYAGKTLNISNSLKQQYIEDQAELIVIQHRPPKDAFQKEAFEYNSSYHLKEKNQVSSVENNCPVTFLTNVDSLKKKNQQQAALVHNQNASHVAPAPAGPKPFPLPSTPVLNDSFLNGNAPFNINISTIQAESAEAPQEPIAPGYKSQKKTSKKSSDIQRCAPLSQEKIGEIKIKVNKLASDIIAPSQEKQKIKDKLILQLQSTQVKLKQPAPFPFPFPQFTVNDHKNEKDTQPKSAKPSE